MTPDTALKLAIYAFTADHARVPTVADLAPRLGLAAAGAAPGVALDWSLLPPAQAASVATSATESRRSKCGGIGSPWGSRSLDLPH